MDGIYERKMYYIAKNSNTSDLEICAAPGVGRCVVIEQIVLSSEVDNVTFTFKASDGVTPVTLIGPIALNKTTFSTPKDLNLRVGDNLALSMDVVVTSGNATILLIYHIRGQV